MIQQIFVLLYLGMASAIGLVVDVLILLCSLANSLMLCANHEIPLQFHPDLLAILNVGTDPNRHDGLVNMYAYPWWNSSREPAPDMVLNAIKLEECLQTHCGQWANRDIPPCVLTPVFCNGVAVANCGCCRSYQTLIHGLLAKLHGIHQFVDGLDVSLLNKRDVGVHRAAEFHMLHKHVIQKEMAETAMAMAMADSHPSSHSQHLQHTLPRTKAQKSKLLTEQANIELKRLRLLPDGANKWSWGPAVTKEEVLQLNNIYTR